MKRSRLLVLTTLFAVSVASTATAQYNPGRDTLPWLNCIDNAGAVGAFAHCQLRVVKKRLFRGPQNEYLGESRFLTPIPIERYVVGDSALFYAHRYHRAEKIKSTLAYISGNFLGVSLVGAGACPHALCSRAPHFARNMALIGGGVFVAALPFKVVAVKSINKAIAFYNNSLGR
jgi:hypothetical protein